MQLATKY